MGNDNPETRWFLVWLIRILLAFVALFIIADFKECRQAYRDILNQPQPDNYNIPETDQNER